MLSQTIFHFFQKSQANFNNLIKIEQKNQEN